MLDIKALSNNDMLKAAMGAAGFAWTASAALAGHYWGQHRAKKQLEQRDFLDRLHVSLNMLGDGQLKIRTILERPLGDIVLNPLIKAKVLAAARRATAENPVLDLEASDAGFVLKCIINATAEHFCSGCVRADAGKPVDMTTYALFLTCEPSNENRNRKIRAVLVKEEHLTEFPYKESLPELEREWHNDRVNTLRCAAELYKTRPDLFEHIELCA